MAEPLGRIRPSVPTGSKLIPAWRSSPSSLSRSFLMRIKSPGCRSMLCSHSLLSMPSESGGAEGSSACRSKSGRPGQHLQSVCNQWGFILPLLRHQPGYMACRSVAEKKRSLHPCAQGQGRVKALRSPIPAIGHFRKHAPVARAQDREALEIAAQEMSQRKAAVILAQDGFDMFPDIVQRFYRLVVFVMMGQI